MGGLSWAVNGKRGQPAIRRRQERQPLLCQVKGTKETCKTDRPCGFRSAQYRDTNCLRGLILASFTHVRRWDDLSRFSGPEKRQLQLTSTQQTLLTMFT